MTVTGYKYNNINAANNAKNALRAHYLDNRPSNPDGKPSVSTEVVDVHEDIQGFWYFMGNFSPVLGNPTQFEITTEGIDGN